MIADVLEEAYDEGEEDFLYMVLPVRLKGSDHV